MESKLNLTNMPYALHPPHRSFAEISLSTLASNYAAIAAVLPTGAQMMPVVKANAYGHGAIPVSHKLLECGAAWLAVSSVDEGVALRESGITPATRILVMAGILPFEWTAVFEHFLTPVLHSLDDVRTMDRHALALGRKIPFHFKLDSGLSRMGSIEPLSDIVSLFSSLQATIFEGAMTHFASAADLTSHQTEDQIYRFEEILRFLAEAGISPSIVHTDSTNSLHFPRTQSQRHLVRPGHALYGYVTQPPAATKRGRLQVQPILTWKTRILHVKDLPVDAPVGYGALFHTTRPTRIAVLGIGYADGYPHRLSGKGRVIINGKLAPILGAISMDLTTVDITDLPVPSVGDAVTLIGAEENVRIDAIDLARMAGTISYSILTNIHGRVKRIYTS